MTAVIDVRGVRKLYGTGEVRVQALRGVSFRVEPGEFVSIMGSSGSGKSTLMNVLGLLDVPTVGTYRIDGVDAKGLDEDQQARLRNRKIGFVFQGFNLLPRTTALHNVELPLVYAGVPKGERRRRALEALELVGLGARVNHHSSELSGGQQQRVAVARAVVTNPALVLADEPTGNLDSAATEDVINIFENLNAEGRTIVLITHEPEVAHHTRRIVHLRDGRIVSDEAVPSGSAA